MNDLTINTINSSPETSGTPGGGIPPQTTYQGRTVSPMSATNSDENLATAISDPKKEAVTTSRLIRKIPPVSLRDTTIGFCSAHGKGTLFGDEEILQVHDPVSEETISKDWTTICVGKTKEGKHIIQQQATRGCTAAVAAMLIMDNEKKPNLLELRTRNLDNDHNILMDISDAGLSSVIRTSLNLEDLKELARTNGSTIVSIGGDLGGHVIVIDEITDDRVRLRDPYHGWDITVTMDAFKKRFDGQYAIQVK